MAKEKLWPTLSIITTILLSYAGSTSIIYSHVSSQFNVLDGKVDHTNAVLTDKFEGVEKRTTKLESAVKTLGDEQKDPLKQVIHDLLASAASSLPQDPKFSAKAIRVADSLLAAVKKERRSADSEYFSTTLHAIDELNARIPGSGTQKDVLRELVHSTRISLAEYRSSLNAVPSIPTQTAPFPPITGNVIVTTTGTVYPVTTTINLTPPKPLTIEGNGAVIDARGMRSDQELIIVATRSLDQNPAVFKDFVYIGANQTLDYITWENVTFVGTHIKYSGGPVRLKNVRFVNCTFDLPDTSAGAQVAEYAALESKKPLRVG